jgi:hypothetical protein
MPSEDARAKIQKLLVTGDNRLKQGVDPRKVRESFEQALEVAREAGLEEQVRPLVELRLADLERFAERFSPAKENPPPNSERLRRAGPPPSPPDA